MKKHTIIFCSFMIIQLFICLFTYWHYAGKEADTLTIDKFYLKKDGTEMFYLDSSYDADARTLTTDSFPLNKGSYTVTVSYECNLNPDAIYGTSARVYSTHKDISVNPMKGEVLLPSTTNQVSFDIYSPYNDSLSTLEIGLIANGAFLDDANGTKYILVKDAAITSNPSQTAWLLSGHMLLLFIALDLAIQAMLLVPVNKSNKKYPHIFCLIIEKVSLTLAFFILSLLVYLSTGAVEHVNLMTYEDMPVLYLWNAPLRIVLVIMLALVTSSIAIGLYKLRRNTIITLLVPAIFGIWWILVDEFPVAGDARAVADMAKAIAYNTDPTPYRDYINTYANQRGIVLIEALFYKIFNSNAYIILRFLNLAMILVTIQAISLIAFEIWHNEKIVILSRILLALFVPFVLFTNLVYGTVPSIFLLVIGFFFSLRMYREDRILYSVLSFLCFTLAMFIYQGAMIAVLAIVIYLLFMEKIPRSKKPLITAAFLIVSMLFTSKFASFLFNAITGLELGKGMPAISWIYMGLSAGNGVNGAGSYNNAHAIAYELNNHDPSSASSYCKNKIIEIIGEYLTGKRPLFFFYEKTRCQWTNSMFDSTQITQFPSYDNFVLTDGYRHLLSGKIMQGIILFADIFQLMVYILAFLWLVRAFIRKDAPRKVILLVIFFIGGFLFQLMWEQKARYCMPYFMMLIPLAACELIWLVTVITTKIKQDK